MIISAVHTGQMPSVPNSWYGPGLGGRDDGGLLPGPRGSETTGHQDLGTLQKGSREAEGQSYWGVA